MDGIGARGHTTCIQCCASVSLIFCSFLFLGCRSASLSVGQHCDQADGSGVVQNLLTWFCFLKSLSFFFPCASKPAVFLPFYRSSDHLPSFISSTVIFQFILRRVLQSELLLLSSLKAPHPQHCLTFPFPLVTLSPCNNDLCGS